jgi:DNA-binding PadR family transcriptional regulator
MDHIDTRHMDIRHREHRRGRRDHHRDHDHSGLHRLFGHGRGGRSVRRGNVRFAILSVLQDRPMHGYEVIQELDSRTQGRWRPSAGSVYPTLQLLEDQALVTSEEVDGRRTYSLTDEGKQAAEEHPLTAWLESETATESPDIRRLAASVMEAVMQVRRIGTPESNEAAREILTDARRRLYRLLADDEGEPSS